MPYRKVVTCFITNWVSVLLEMFERSLFPFNSQIAHEHNSSANPSFMPDFKLYTTSACLPRWIRSFIGLHVRCWSGASRSYGLCPYQVGKLHDIYLSDVSGFLSLLLDAWHPVCGIGWDSAETAYCSKPFRYPVGFRVGPAFDGIYEFGTVFDFSGLVAQGFFFSEGFAQRYAISDLSHVRNLPRF